MNDHQAKSGVTLDVTQLKRLIPHRYPFLLIDRLSDVRPAKGAVGWKAVTVNEPHFVGHFPDYAVMPGVLIIEAMAQAAGALVVHTLGFYDQRKSVYFLTVDKARFRKPVHPGDVLRMPVEVQRHRGPVWRFEGRAFVNETLCAEAEFSAMIVDGDTQGDQRPAKE
jgi:3-hydroxyacyl-[acyl-carrier-protein] dehydratase